VVCVVSPAVCSQDRCEIDPVPGGVDIAINPGNRDVLVASAGLRLFHSADEGLSYSARWLGIEGLWPSISFRGRELFVAAGRWGSPNEIFLIHSDDGGETFGPARTVHSSLIRRLIDPELLLLADGGILVFLTEITSELGQPSVFTIGLFRSDDDGDSWQRLPDAVVGPDEIRIEDAKAVELENGDLLLAYEFEIEDLGSSRIEQVRSTDGGFTWDGPTILWDDVPLSDDEPGGYQWIGPGELWFVASTDEDSIESYTEAVVKRKVSTDHGLTWHSKTQLVDEPDQIVFGTASDYEGHVLLATVRHYTSTPRTLSIYHVDPESPGVSVCRPLLFVGGSDSGTTNGWSAVHH